MTDRSLLGRVALVTGAGSGLGAATACALAQHGARVACLDLDEAHARQTAPLELRRRHAHIDNCDEVTAHAQQRRLE